MTAHKSRQMVRVTAYRATPTTLRMEWEQTSIVESGQSPARPHRRVVLVQHSADLLPGDLTALVQRMATYVLATGKHRVAIPRGMAWHEVGGEAVPVPPSGGEGGESSSRDELGTEPLPGIDGAATITMPPPPVKQETASRRKPRLR